MQPWTITYDGQSWTDETAKVMHLVAVAELTGDTWGAVSPWNGPRQLAAWLAVLLATHIGDLDVATAKVHAMSVAELAATLSERTDVLTSTD